LEAHVQAVQAALSTCRNLPALYYSYPSIYNDDFELDKLLRAVRDACPTVIGAKLSGAAAKDAAKAWAMEDFAIIKTGHSMLPGAIQAGVKGWVCYLWEVDAARVLISAASSSENDEDVSTAMEKLATLRTSVLEKRAAAPHSNYQISADKAFMSAWSGVDVGKCRLPLPSLSDGQEAELSDLASGLESKGLLRRPFSPQSAPQ
jgi:dihydrodipicolinate synthase/N-acetylneuraminate lyase